MARLVNGANGPYIGKAGSYIGFTVNGIGYIKGLYKKRTTPPTIKEELNRKKFTLAQAWLQPVQDFVRVGFKGYNERFQGFVAAKSWLMKNAFILTESEPSIDPSLVKISSGSLDLPADITCTLQEPNILCFKWDSSAKEDNGYDQAMILAYNIQDGHTYGNTYGNCRHVGEQVLTLNEYKRRIFHIYVGFIAADRSRQSDSLYVGKYEF